MNHVRIPWSRCLSFDQIAASGSPEAPDAFDVDEVHVYTLRAAGETAPEVWGNLAPDPPVIGAAASVSVAPTEPAAPEIRATILLLPSPPGESCSNTLVAFLSFDQIAASGEPASPAASEVL